MRRPPAKTTTARLMLGLCAMTIRPRAAAAAGGGARGEASVPYDVSDARRDDARGVLRGRNRRVADRPRALHPARRRLEDEAADEMEEGEEEVNDNEEEDYEEEEGGYGDDRYYELVDDAYGDDAYDDAYADDVYDEDVQQTNSTAQVIITKILTWESIAVANLKTWESSANSTIYKYYETSMDQWTNSQWDLLYDFLFWIAIGTCLCVTCCDRCCCTESELEDLDEENDVKIETVASLPSWRSPQSPRTPLEGLASIRSRSRSPPPRRSRRSRKDKNRRSRRNQSARDDGQDDYVLYDHADDDASTVATEMTDNGRGDGEGRPASYKVGFSVVVLLFLFLFMLLYNFWIGNENGQPFFGLMVI